MEFCLLHKGIREKKSAACILIVIKIMIPINYHVSCVFFLSFNPDRLEAPRNNSDVQGFFLFFFSFLSIEFKISNLCSNPLMVYREHISVEISCTLDLLSVYLTKKLQIRLYDVVRHNEVNF